MATLNLQVGEIADDANEKGNGAIGLNYPVVFGSYGPYDTASGMRFPSVSGLSLATINSATLTLMPWYSDTGTFSGNFYAEDAASPLVFTVIRNDITNRTQTSASCAAGDAEFGPWTKDVEETFGPGAGLEALVQELADSHDPDAIVLIHIYVSGTGERVATAYDQDPATAPKLDIDYTAASGAQTLFPDAAAITWGADGPAVVVGASSPTPDAAVLDVQAPQATVVATRTFTPDAAVATWTAPAAAIVNARTFTPDAAVATWTALSPTIISGSPQTMEPDAAVVTWAAPQATVAAGAVALAPIVAIAVWTATASAIVATRTLTPSAAVTTWVASAPTIVPDAVALTPDAAVATWVTPEAEIIGPVALAYRFWGYTVGVPPSDVTYPVLIEINKADFPAGTAFYLQAWVWSWATESPPPTLYVRLYNYTDGTEVEGSEMTTEAETLERLDGTVDLAGALPSASKEYAVQFGGVPGGEFHCHGAKVRYEVT